MLLKKEEICESCDTHYIIAFKEEDLPTVFYCPFCGGESEYEEVDSDQEGE